MNDDEQPAGAVAGCEATARDRGHALGFWYSVAEQFHASLCEVCGVMG